jgi:hypothetical protein
MGSAACNGAGAPEDADAEALDAGFDFLLGFFASASLSSGGVVDEKDRDRDPAA